MASVGHDVGCVRGEKLLPGHCSLELHPRLMGELRSCKEAKAHTANLCQEWSRQPGVILKNTPRKLFLFSEPLLDSFFAVFLKRLDADIPNFIAARVFNSAHDVCIFGAPPLVKLATVFPNSPPLKKGELEINCPSFRVLFLHLVSSNHPSRAEFFVLIVRNPVLGESIGVLLVLDFTSFKCANHLLPTILSKDSKSSDYLMNSRTRDSVLVCNLLQRHPLRIHECHTLVSRFKLLFCKFHLADLDAQEFVNSVRLGTQYAACYCLNLQLPVCWREFIPSSDGRLFDAETAGGLGLGAEKLDDFFCSHASSIAATITQDEGRA